MDGIDSKIAIPTDHMISENIKEKGGQGSRPQYYARKPNPPEPAPEEEAPEEPGKPKHLIDIKV